MANMSMLTKPRKVCFSIEEDDKVYIENFSKRTQRTMSGSMRFAISLLKQLDEDREERNK